MKNLTRIAVMAITFSVISLTAVYTAAQDVRVPTKKELVTLLKAAKEPSDHLRIAAYYTQKAEHLRNEAQQHSEMAAVYGQSRPFTAMESKHGYDRGQSASHCKRFAQLALDEARKADALAALHKEMADAYTEKQK